MVAYKRENEEERVNVQVHYVEGEERKINKSDYHTTLNFQGSIFS